MLIGGGKAILGILKQNFNEVSVFSLLLCVCFHLHKTISGNAIWWRCYSRYRTGYVVDRRRKLSVTKFGQGNYWKVTKRG